VGLSGLEVPNSWRTYQWADGPLYFWASLIRSPSRQTAGEPFLAEILKRLERGKLGGNG
jgi:hypothetical protein